MKNYYDLLEVNPKASREIIEKAYRVLEGNISNNLDYRKDIGEIYEH